MKRDKNRTGRNGTKSGHEMVGRTVQGKLGSTLDENHVSMEDSITTTLANVNTAIKVYIGPSVEGIDKKFVKVLSGEVDRRKPSFA